MYMFKSVWEQQTKEWFLLADTLDLARLHWSSLLRLRRRLHLACCLRSLLLWSGTTLVACQQQ